MEFIDHRGEIEIIGVSDFDPEKIFECGQCFRWDADERGFYYGVAHGRVTRVRSYCGSVFISCSIEDFEAVWYDYFDFCRDYREIRRQLCVDDFMLRATEFGAGIRILRQESWETLCSFIFSQCNNIPRIRKIIESLCQKFGDRIEFEGKSYFTFPSADRIAALDEKSLAFLRSGYRAAYVIDAAKAVVSGNPDLESLSRFSTEDARTSLKALRGVGDKVADCVVLFGYNMLDAFPLDVWVKRAVAKFFNPEFDPVIFSPYAGIAQQYIFYYIRSEVSK